MYILFEGKIMFPYNANRYPSKIHADFVTNEVFEVSGKIEVFACFYKKYDSLFYQNFSAV